MKRGLKKGEISAKQLIKQYREGSIEARDTLFQRYMPFVEEVTKEYKGLGLSEEDLFQSGCEGVLLAIETYNIESKMMFVTSAKRKIIKSILCALMDHFGINVYETKKQPIFVKIELYKRIKALEEEFTENYGRKPTFNELCEILKFENISYEEFNQLLLDSDFISVSESNFPEFICTETARPGEQELIVKEINEELQSVFPDVPITERTREVIKEIYLEDMDLNLKRISSKFGVTACALGQCQSDAFGKILRYKKRELRESLFELTNYRQSKNPIYSLKP